MERCVHGKDKAFACSACMEAARLLSAKEIVFDPPISIERFDDFADALFNPMAYAARVGARIAKLYATHDPCELCGHGRLLHKRSNFDPKKYPEAAARDAALSETQCRGVLGRSCACEAWKGTETPFPKGPY